jgi:hypothetical protein
MLVTGSPTVSDDLGQRLSDSGKDQSPARRFFGAASLQQLSQHLTRRSSSPLARAVATTAGTTAAATAVGSSPRSAAATAAAVATAPQAVDAHAAGPSGWAKRTPSPSREGQGTGAAASAAPAAAAPTPPAAGQLQQQQHPMAASVEPAAAPQLQPSPIIVMTDAAAVAAGSAEASLTHTLSGKRKVGNWLHIRTVAVLGMVPSMGPVGPPQAAAGRRYLPLLTSMAQLVVHLLPGLLVCHQTKMLPQQCLQSEMIPQQTHSQAAASAAAAVAASEPSQHWACLSVLQHPSLRCLSAQEMHSILCTILSCWLCCYSSLLWLWLARCCWCSS